MHEIYASARALNHFTHFEKYEITLLQDALATGTTITSEEGTK